MYIKMKRIEIVLHQLVSKSIKEPEQKEIFLNEALHDIRNIISDIIADLFRGKHK